MLSITLNYLYLPIFLIIFITINPNLASSAGILWVPFDENEWMNANPNPVNFSCWRKLEKTHVLTNSSHVRLDIRYRARIHDLSGEPPMPL